MRVPFIPFVLLAGLFVAGVPQPGAAEVKVGEAVSADSLERKVLCGYQGWFRCPGDGTDRGWVHWSRDRRRIAPETLTFEMWPDLSESLEEEKFPVPGFRHPDGRQAHLFSSAHPRTVERHFAWMQEYHIDGAFVQRFLVALDDPSQDLVLSHVRAAARKSGRVFALTYDMSGMATERIYERLTSDWKRLVDEAQITRDDRYLHHNGKPVLMVWGFYPDRFDAALVHRLLDFFQQHPKYAVTLIGGCTWQWRQTPDPEWARAFRRFDILSPWNVGNVSKADGRRYASVAHWRDDMAEAQRTEMGFLPVIWPGFGWDNLQQTPAGSSHIPRLGGEFYWRQFVAASDLGLNTVYIAMFDEVDEATAIFKVTNQPPAPGRFLTYEGLPSDAYLRLTRHAAAAIHLGHPVPPATPPVGRQEAQSP